MKRLFVFFIMILLFTCCKSNNVEPINTQEKVTDYFPLSIGNYWVYQVYRADSTLNFTKTNQIDSIYVQKDTLVNGRVYKVVKQSFFNNTLLIRDSANYIIDHTGKKYLTINQTDEILSKTFYSGDDLNFVLSFKMKNTDSTCIVPSGSYSSKYVIGALSCTQANSKYKDRRLFYAYSKGLGMVSRRLVYLIVNEYLEDRLIRYKIIDK